MARSTPADSTLDDEVRERLRDVLSRHPITFAIVFGSTARGTATGNSDIDIAVAFEDIRPDDTGYSRVYLRLSTDLADALATDVDIVDVYSMSPRFARAVFDSGDLLIGTEEKRRALETELAGEPISLDEASERISAAVDRMTK
ncbi:type VII toxin-antitoxin system MntA family adenylyltransferase antitoxin [Halomarina pelagica]|uniref:type VII toxin-antitoxin system MntA family adenylyltransferase antitoxin n=1 Tax=Halomarina pelagica TaxID=2961599 RepID=UPI0020C1C398|nr:nucleotidyltransferase domain-containing protein [Halomarina sp. BND7]